MQIRVAGRLTTSDKEVVLMKYIAKIIIFSIAFLIAFTINVK